MSLGILQEMFLDLNMIYILTDSKFEKSASQRGEERKGNYLLRIQTGKTDSDGSPTYRYIRSVEELKAFKRRHKNTKITHEDQKREAHKIEEKVESSKKTDNKEDKSNKEDTKESKKKVFVKDSKTPKKVKKGLYV